MLKVGLTGGIGSGKTTVAKIFEILGVPVFYADKEAKELMVTDKDIRSSVKVLFGEGAYLGNRLNRNYIADKVFKNDNLLVKLNSVVHPAVFRHFFNWTESYPDASYVIHEAAVLFESGAKKYFDYVVLVTAPEIQRIERVKLRDGSEEEQIRERMKHQMPEEEKVSLSNFVINNDNNTLIVPQILQLHKKLISLKTD